MTKTALILLLILSIDFTAKSAEPSHVSDSNFIKTKHIVSNIDTTFAISDTLELDTNNIVNTKNELTFWEKYIEPAIAVLSAATITLLLFGMRSKQ